MISRKHRFHGHGSLKFLLTKGKTLRSSNIGVRYIHNPKRDNYRLAVVVSKKVDNSAVVRNRIRRRIFEFVRKEYGDQLSHIDLAVFVYDKRVAIVDHSALKAILQPLFEQLLDASVQSEV